MKGFAGLVSPLTWISPIPKSESGIQVFSLSLLIRDLLTSSTYGMT